MTTMPLSIINDYFKLMPSGLSVEGEPSKEEWFKVGRLLVYLRDSVHWLIGDWLNYGIEHYQLTYEKASCLLNEYGFVFSNQTLRNDKYVASRIPLSCRHDKLTWQHHKEVASLDPDQRTYWLSYATDLSLTTKDLREAIKGRANCQWLRLSDIWDFEKCDNNFGLENPGRIPGQAIQNLLSYYSRPGSFVVDPTGIDGTTLDVCTKYPQLKRKCLIFDVQPMRKDILEANAMKPWPTRQPADFIFINATRYSILRFDQDFGIAMRKILGQAVYNLNPAGVLSVLIEPRSADDPCEDWSFEAFKWLKYEMNLQYERRITLPIPANNIESRLKTDARKSNNLLTRFRDLLIFRKTGLQRCSRCGIFIGTGYKENESFKLNGEILCHTCLQSVQMGWDK